VDRDDEDAVTEPEGDPAAPDASENDALLQRLGLIEDQPLDERADAYARVHAELHSHLEGSDERR